MLRQGNAGDNRKGLEMERDCFYNELKYVRNYACKAAGLDPEIAGWKTAVDAMTKQLADAQATVEALQRVRDEFERERDQLHAALVEAVLLRDHNLRRCDVLDSKYKKGLAAVKVLQSQLSQLQALVRAYLEARKSIDSDLAEQARENLKHALDATTPAVCPDCDGDGAVDSGGTDPNGNPLMRRCGCREKKMKTGMPFGAKSKNEAKTEANNRKRIK